MADLRDMTQQQVIDYLMQAYGGQNLGPVSNPYDRTGEEGYNWDNSYGYNPITGAAIYGVVPYEYYSEGDDAGYRPGAVTGYQTMLTPNFDPNYEGGVYGGYYGNYDLNGNLTSVSFGKGERHKGFIGENLDWLGPLLVLGPAAYAGLGAAAGAAETAAMESAIGGAGGLGGYTAGTGAAGLGGLTAAEELAGLEAAIGGEGGLGGYTAGTAAAGAAEGATSGLWDTPYLTEAETLGGELGTDWTKYLTLKNAGKALQAAGLLGAALGSSSGGGGGTSNKVNLITPKTLTRTTTGTPVTSQQAYDYLLGKPTGTTQPLTSQQKWFDNQWTQGVSYDPTNGKQYVPDPTTGQLREVLTQPQAQAQTPTTTTPTETAANGGLMALAAGGGVDGHLGGYSDGGRLLRGPGDGVSDSIPATIGGKQPARLADGEFVVPARIVSELGNGSTEAGARKLYAMMDRIQQGRKKSIGKGRVAVNSKADKHLPA